MSSVLLVGTPVHGHIAPLLPIARELVAAGDRVRFLTGRKFRAAVEATGATWLPLPAEADYDDATLDVDFPGRVGLTGPKGIAYDIREIFVRPLPAQTAAIDAALAAEPTDAILAESLSVGVLPIALRPRAARPAVIGLGIVPNGMSAPNIAPFGLGIPPLGGPLGRLRNAVLRLVTERGVFGGVQRYAVERMRTAGAHLDDFILDYGRRLDGMIQFTVPAFEYPRRYPIPVDFVGPISRITAASDGAELPGWWSDLDAGRPVVHVTQGTVANTDFEDLILPTLRGLADRDVLVVVSTGGRDATALRAAAPANARIAEYLPYDRLLPKTDVMVTNGGYGGVHYALGAGVPVVVAGLTEDKIEVSQRVAWSGVGVNLRTNRPTAAAVAAGVDRVLADPSYRTASAAVGAAIAESPGVAGIRPVLQRLIAPTIAVA